MPQLKMITRIRSMAKEDDNQCIPVYCGIFIVHGGLKFVDFVGNPYPRMFHKIMNSLAVKCNKSSYVTHRISSPRTSKIWTIHVHWPPRIRMIPQCCFISLESINFRNVLRKQCSATKTYPLQQTRCSSGHEMLMVLVLYVVLYSGEALLHKEQMNHLSLERYLLCNKK